MVERIICSVRFLPDLSDPQTPFNILAVLPLYKIMYERLNYYVSYYDLMLKSYRVDYSIRNALAFCIKMLFLI